ncbi:hypothetical protein EJB05_35703, partial [Eragrostis curvula]
MAIQWDKTTIIVTSVVGSLGVLSAIFGFSAEGTKLTPYTILVLDDECIYPSNPALALAVCAIVFLLLAQVIISAVGGCCGRCKSRAIPSETKRVVGLVCAVVSWIAAVIACVLLGEGASWNANVVRVGPAPFCPYLKDGILAGGGVLTLVATALGLTSFLLLRSQQPAAAAPASTPNIAMGHPQFQPAPSATKPPTFEQQPPLYPPKPQVYPAAEVSPPPTASHAQGYVHAAPAPLNQQFSPHHPAAQGYGSHAPNQQPYPPPPQQQQYAPPQQQYSPPQQQFSPPPQVVYAQQQPSYSPQYAAQPQVDMQVPAPPAPPSQQQQGGEEGDGGQSGMDLFKAGAKLFMRVAEHTLSSDNNNNEDATASDSTTQDGGGQDTNYA